MTRGWGKFAIFSKYGCARQITPSVKTKRYRYLMSIAGIGELRFSLHRAFKHAPLSRISFALAGLSCIYCGLTVLQQVQTLHY